MEVLHEGLEYHFFLHLRFCLVSWKMGAKIITYMALLCVKVNLQKVQLKYKLTKKKKKKKSTFGQDQTNDHRNQMTQFSGVSPSLFFENLSFLIRFVVGLHISSQTATVIIYSVSPFFYNNQSWPCYNNTCFILLWES